MFNFLWFVDVQFLYLGLSLSFLLALILIKCLMTSVSAAHLNGVQLSLNGFTKCANSNYVLFSYK